MRLPLYTPLVGGFLLALLPGCLTFGGSPSSTGDGDDDDGESRPTFVVEAERTASTCGSGELTLDKSWSFEATITVDDEEDVVVFDTGKDEEEAPLEADGKSFTLITTLEVNMRTANDGLPPCTIRRTDVLDAALDDPEDPKGFTGTLSYRFEPTDGSDCSDLTVGEDKLVEKLPCTASYDVDAESKDKE